VFRGPGRGGERQPEDEPAMTWYSGEGGLTGLARTVAGVANDVSRVRRAWHWDTPRPHTWPEQGAVVPAPASDLGWARQGPGRALQSPIPRRPLTQVPDPARPAPAVHGVDGSSQGRGPRMGPRAGAARHLRRQSLEPCGH